MEQVLRISGCQVLSLQLEGLNEAQADNLRRFVFPSEPCGADLQSAPLYFPPESPGSKTDGHRRILTGTPAQLKDCLARLRTRNGLPEHLLVKAESALDNYRRSDYKIKCGDKLLDLGSHTHIMGILNVTPDSFSDGGLYADSGRALVHAKAMLAAGADILDIGGESTRPGAEPVSEEEELRRIIPLISCLSGEVNVPLSVDTYKSTVAEKALRAGASIVNDISGLRFSQDMAKVVADYGAALVIMHIKGEPRNMQQNPRYDDVIGEVLSYLEEGLEIADKAGVDREKVMIDPGIGFGKTLEHNLTILNRLDEFRILGRPIVLGTSRKKFIGTVLGIAEPEQRIDGTAATVALGIERGASVLRVHDVAQMTRVARMSDAIVKNKHQ